MAFINKEIAAYNKMAKAYKKTKDEAIKAQLLEKTPHLKKCAETVDAVINGEIKWYIVECTLEEYGINEKTIKSIYDELKEYSRLEELIYAIKDAVIKDLNKNSDGWIGVANGLFEKAFFGNTTINEDTALILNKTSNEIAVHIVSEISVMRAVKFLEEIMRAVFYCPGQKYELDNIFLGALCEKIAEMNNAELQGGKNEFSNFLRTILRYGRYVPLNTYTLHEENYVSDYIFEIFKALLENRYIDDTVKNNIVCSFMDSALSMNTDAFLEIFPKLVLLNVENVHKEMVFYCFYSKHTEEKSRQAQVLALAWLYYMSDSRINSEAKGLNFDKKQVKLYASEGILYKFHEEIFGYLRIIQDFLEEYKINPDAYVLSFWIEKLKVAYHFILFTALLGEASEAAALLEKSDNRDGFISRFKRISSDTDGTYMAELTARFTEYHEIFGIPYEENALAEKLTAFKSAFIALLQNKEADVVN